MRRIFRGRVLAVVMLVAFAVSISGCGYILYPERQKSRLTRHVDTKTVVFDCLWLLAFVVPGVVALLVDGTHDTWYYTTDEWEIKTAGESPRFVPKEEEKEKKKEASASPAGKPNVRAHVPGPPNAA